MKFRKFSTATHPKPLVRVGFAYGKTSWEKFPNRLYLAKGSTPCDVKISLPEAVGLEIEAKSTFGKVQSRLSDIDSSLESGKKGKTHRLRRIGAGEICRVKAQTTTGNVLFKDTEK